MSKAGTSKSEEDIEKMFRYLYVANGFKGKVELKKGRS